MSAGYLLLGVAMLKVGVVPRWSGPAVVVSLAALWSTNAFGWIIFGLAWMLLGNALRSGRVAPAKKRLVQANRTPFIRVRGEHIEGRSQRQILSIPSARPTATRTRPPDSSAEARFVVIVPPAGSVHATRAPPGSWRTAPSSV
jgi:hypothetical protein